MEEVGYQTSGTVRDGVDREGEDGGREEGVRSIGRVEMTTMTNRNRNRNRMTMITAMIADPDNLTGNYGSEVKKKGK